ncbi:glycosyltransferase [Emticicia sp. CRIBPO]|uniref:glycosyltransferase n=1 Tax=Emticicia sp. CRIBPO TaxID=2683258 RepID=UPI001413672C|nr:glycosyltransferase [Emticicia sp. CRIBPO]NBA84236.1 glycosyltransferase [Emticicia sp. CRIBPO]
MRILHITGYTVERGGTSKVVFDNVSYQLLQGNTVDIITVDFPGEKTYPLPEGAGLIKVGYSPLNKYVSDYSPGFYAYLKANRDLYDIIHIHGIWHWGSIVPFLVSGKFRVIISIHGMLSRWALSQGGIKKKIFGEVFQKRFLRKSDAVIVLTEAEKEELLEYIPLKESKVHVIPNGIEKIEVPSVQQKKDLLDKLGLKSDSVNILFLSRIHKKKGLDLLLKAFARLSAEIPEAKLLIAGPDEGYKHTAEEMIDALNIRDRILFLGSVSGKEKETVFSIAGVFVLSSYSEGLPMSVLEAMSLRIPVVVSDQTRIDTFIRQYNAGKVTGLNENEVYEAIKDILENPDETREYIENAGKLVETEFGPDMVNKRIIRLYEDSLSKPE